MVGILLAFQQTVRLFREVRWINSFRAGSEVTEPVLLAPMKAMLSRSSTMAFSTASMRTMLDRIATRLDESRDIFRYLIGLLIFLGLLGTFWGLLATIGSISETIQSLDPGRRRRADVLDTLKAGSPHRSPAWAPPSRRRCSASSGSLVLGFLDLQAGRAQTRFYTELENWLSSVTDATSDIERRRRAGVETSDEIRALSERLREAITEGGSNRGVTTAMANLADGISGAGQEHAHRAADHARLGRVPGRAAARDPPPARTSCARERHQVGAPMAIARARRDIGLNYWPGFVDALATLILGIIFVLTVFVVVQFYLTQEVTGKDTALTRLTAQITQLTELLSMEKTGKLRTRSSSPSCAPAWRRRNRARPLSRALRGRRQRRRRRAGQGGGAFRPTRQRAADDRPHAGAGRSAQPADRGAAPAARGAGRGAGHL